MEPRSAESRDAAIPPEGREASDAQASPRMLLRFAWGFAGVFMPFICFAISFPGQPSWQSGEVRAYAALLMSHEASMPVYPLLLFSMICLVLLIARPAHYAENGWIWLGVFLGVVLAVEYWIVFVTAMSAAGRDFDLSIGYLKALLLSSIAVAVPWFATRLIIFALVRLAEPRKNVLVIILQIAALVVLPVLAVFAFPYWAMLCLICSTPWAVGAYGSAAAWLIWRRGAPYFRYTLAELFIATTALAASFAAWRMAYQIMLANYDRLPTQPPPGCFICSAAARGHSFVVRSESYHSACGRELLVNDQLRILKAFELLILATSPAAHRALRQLYDSIGPRVAVVIVHPLAADAAYFALKPIEWPARFVLRIVLGRHTALIARLYRV
jgi:hypothetical protein